MCESICWPSAPTWRSVSVRSSIPACSPASSRRTGALPARARPIWTAGPRSPEPIDLLQHNCLVYTLQPTDRWFFRRQAEARDAFEQVPVTGTLRADDSEPLRDAAVCGLGVVLLPTWLVGEDIKAGRLRHVLPGWSSMIATKPSGI